MSYAARSSLRSLRYASQKKVSVGSAACVRRASRSKVHEKIFQGNVNPSQRSAAKIIGQSGYGKPSIY